MCSYIKTSRHPRHCTIKYAVVRRCIRTWRTLNSLCACAFTLACTHGFAASPQTACLRFFQTGLKSKSFYLSERMELSNKPLSFSATSVSFLSLRYAKSFHLSSRLPLTCTTRIIATLSKPKLTSNPTAVCSHTQKTHVYGRWFATDRFPTNYLRSPFLRSLSARAFRSARSRNRELPRSAGFVEYMNHV